MTPAEKANRVTALIHQLSLPNVPLHIKMSADLTQISIDKEVKLFAYYDGAVTAIKIVDNGGAYAKVVRLSGYPINTLFQCIDHMLSYYRHVLATNNVCQTLLEQEVLNVSSKLVFLSRLRQPCRYVQNAPEPTYNQLTWVTE